PSTPARPPHSAIVDWGKVAAPPPPIPEPRHASRLWADAVRLPRRFRSTGEAHQRRVERRPSSAPALHHSTTSKKSPPPLHRRSNWQIGEHDRLVVERT